MISHRISLAGIEATGMLRAAEVSARRTLQLTRAAIHNFFARQRGG